MSLWIDIKYLKLLNLDQFQEKSYNKFHFRCPVCGDSQHSNTKKRGWATEHKGDLWIKCFNCEYSAKFKNLLKFYFNSFYSDYIREKLSETGQQVFKVEQEPAIEYEQDELELCKITDLPNNHKAVEYLNKRKIPQYHINKCYYSQYFQNWANKNFNQLKRSSRMDPRVVIPFRSRHKKIFAMQGRTIIDNGIKYLTLKIKSDMPKIFGMDDLDMTQDIKVVEGPIDSMFLFNGLAMAGLSSDISYLDLLAPRNRYTFIMDNERHNKPLCDEMRKLAEKGFKVFVWPKTLRRKDINDLVLDGLTMDEIDDMIAENTFTGYKAIVMTNLWKAFK